MLGAQVRPLAPVVQFELAGALAEISIAYWATTGVVVPWL